MNRTRALLSALLVVLSAIGVGPAVAQEDFVTLTVTVETTGGDPVKGATLTATWDGGSTTRTTAANGKAFVDVPAGAAVNISVAHDDYVRNFPLALPEASEGAVTMTVHPKASARVVVEDADGRIPGATVTLRKQGRDVVQESTGDDGVLNTGTIEAGSYTLFVRKPGYFTVRETLAVDGDAETVVRLRRGTVTLEVNVTDDHFEPPRSVGGATVNVEQSGSVTTQPSGIGRISVPVNAWARIRVTADGYQTTAESVYVREDDRTVDLSIQRVPAISVDLLSSRVVIGESVSLTVTDEYDDPVEGATVRVDGEAVAETDASGQAVVRVDSAGNHTVTVEADSLEATTYVRGVSADAATATATPATTTTTETERETTAVTPGFGVGVAMVALAVVVAGLLRRRGKS